MSKIELWVNDHNEVLSHITDFKSIINTYDKLILELKRYTRYKTTEYFYFYFKINITPLSSIRVTIQDSDLIDLTRYFNLIKMSFEILSYCNSNFELIKSKKFIKDNFFRFYPSSIDNKYRAESLRIWINIEDRLWIHHENKPSRYLKVIENNISYLGLTKKDKKVNLIWSIYNKIRNYFYKNENRTI